MAQLKAQLFAWFVLMMVVSLEATPPGIAKNPSHATCKIKKYKHCYNLVHVCPKFCPDSCTVECASCKPICSAGSSPPPEDGSGDGHDYSPPSTTPSPSTPYPTPTPSTPSTPTPTPSTPTPSTPSTPTPSTPTPTPSTPTTTPTPSTPSPTPPTTPSTPWTPTPSTTSPKGPATAKCRNYSYPQCYNIKHVCPAACPGGCEVDCVTCKPVCNCDRPGAVCQDPRFIGGDGLTFYFHGKKDKDFCLVSDPNLHINAHFIGKRNQNMKRDFTWVQSITIFFNTHKLFIGALKTSTWEDSIDRLALSFDGQPITLPQSDGSTWQSTSISISRLGETNSVEIESQGKFRITAKVVPITEQDSKVHNYGITKDDCFAHLDLGFKFYTLSDKVSGVLGQTYRTGYVSRVKMGVSMPVMGGDRDFQTSSLFSTDCAVSRFNGKGVACKR